MKLFFRCLIFATSLLLLSLICFVSYKLGKRKGLKKSLYQISYRALCVIFSFIVAPFLNEYILNFDLYDIEKYIKYQGMYFYRIIDFVEEVIVHNEVLNDIYNFIPSLKNLLMDFPQVLTIPIVYVITFILISLFLLPLYLFLSYKRKRRDLYDKKHSKKYGVWAGVINAIEVVFLISIILTPINGLSRIYKDTSKNLVSRESNICLQNKYLEKYDLPCKLIEGYNSSVFSLIGDNPINKYIYASLTRINYDNKETSLNKEVVSIARAGIVLNKTGLLDAINVESFEDVTSLNFSGLTEEDIDVVVEAFEQSLYTKDVIYEVYEWSKSYLDWLIQDLIDEEFKATYKYEDMVGELKIVLTAINYIISNNDVLENVAKIYEIVDNYKNKPMYDKNVSTDVKLFFDISYALDIDALIELYTLLKDSKIYKDFIPQIVDHLLLNEGIEITSARDPEEFNQAVLYALNIMKIIQNHKYIYNIVHLLSELTIQELHYIAEVVEYLASTKTLNHLLPDLAEFGIKDSQIEMDLPLHILYEIKDWDRELELVGVVMDVVYTHMSKGYIDYDRAWYGLTTYDDTILFKTAFKYAISILPKAFTMWIAGKDYRYLVGYYVV